MHACSGPWPERCPSYPDAERVAIDSLAHAADHEVEVHTVAGCAEVQSAALGYPTQKRAGSLHNVKIDISITQCGASADHSEIVNVVCHDPPSTTAGARAQPDQGRSLEAYRTDRPVFKRAARGLLLRQTAT